MPVAQNFAQVLTIIMASRSRRRLPELREGVRFQRSAYGSVAFLLTLSDREFVISGACASATTAKDASIHVVQRRNLPANTPTSLPMRTTLLFLTSISGLLASAQSDPCITNWMINTTSIQGRHYVAGNSTPVQDNALANVQQVQYSDDQVYVHTNGIPAYITGPFLDGNPSLATSQNAIFRFPRMPVENTGTPTPTNGGNIGNFINGVAMFDFRDGVIEPDTNALCGGPGNPCPAVQARKLEP
jgi:hypothetical protein